MLEKPAAKRRLTSGEGSVTIVFLARDPPASSSSSSAPASIGSPQCVRPPLHERCCEHALLPPQQLVVRADPPLQQLGVLVGVAVFGVAAVAHLVVVRADPPLQQLVVLVGAGPPGVDDVAPAPHSIAVIAYQQPPCSISRLLPREFQKGIRA